jgi:hypothetical protein
MPNICSDYVSGRAIFPRIDLRQRSEIATDAHDNAESKGDVPLKSLGILIPIVYCVYRLARQLSTLEEADMALRANVA